MKQAKALCLLGAELPVVLLVTRALLGFALSFSFFTFAFAQEEKKEVPKRIHIGEAVVAAKLLHKPDPKYPDLARLVGIHGPVELKATIAQDGTIKDLRVYSGHPLLVKAALDAVLHWRYEPTLLGGEPVEVTTQINVVFRLANGELDVIYRNLRDYEQAIRVLREAVRLKPRDAGLRVALAIVLDDSGDLDGAVTEYRKSIRINRNLAEAHVNLGVALASQRKIKAAIVEFRKAIRIDPNDARHTSTSRLSS